MSSDDRESVKSRRENRIYMWRWNEIKLTGLDKQTSVSAQHWQLQ